MEIRTGAQVERVDDRGVVVAGQRIASRTVLWTAGVLPLPAGKWLRAETDRAGRVSVRPDLSVPGRPEVFVVGDTAHLEHNGKPLPGVAQVAMQQGRYVGKLIASRVGGGGACPAFRYFDNGNMAVIGRNFAILEAGKLRLAGSRPGRRGRPSICSIFRSIEARRFADGPGRISGASEAHA